MTAENAQAPKLDDGAAMDRAVRDGFAAHRTDVLVAATIVVATFLVTMAAASQVDPTAFARRNFDIYLQGDLPRTYIEMVNAGAGDVIPMIFA